MKRSFILIVNIWPLLFINAQQGVLGEKVSIRFNNQTVSEALQLLMEEAGCTIIYQSADLPEGRTFTKSFQQAKIETIIREVWGNDLLLSSKDGSISIKVNQKKVSNGELLSGYLIGNNDEPLPFATVGIKGTNIGVISDENGYFELNDLSIGPHVLIVSSSGYSPKEVTINIQSGRQNRLTVSLEESINSLEEVVVQGKSIAQEIAEQPITISTINAGNLQAQTQDIANVLDKVEGVRIRQSGGLGSATNISINGLTGNAIRFYYNGIPAEFLGGGFQLNTLPISNVDRVEVYKGVMPANLATDALGGGINIVTNTDGEKKTDLSYQFGSFNTHRAAASLTRPIGDRWFVNVNANYNYSDNDFEMEVQNNTYNANLNFPTGIETIRVRRFHDAFSTFFGNSLVGFDDEDKGLSLRFGAYVTSTFNEFQHGIRVSLVPAGAFSVRSQDSYLKLDLEKSIKETWKFNYSGVGGYSRIQVRDSTQNIYDWYGRIVGDINPEITRSTGAELLSRPSISDIYSYNAVQRFGLIRHLPLDFYVSLNHFFAYQKREGTEALEINYIGGIDPNEEGFRITRNITSLELKKTFLGDKLELLSTLKSYQYSTRGVNTLIRDRNNQTELPVVTSDEQAWGFNIASKWTLSNKLFVRVSFEDAVRIPSQNEIFGDLRTIVPNLSIKPERSRNMNVGFNADFRSYLKASVSYFVRSQRDLILLQFLDTETARFINRSKVFSSGIEAAFRGSITERLSYSWNTTYFNIEIREVDQPQDNFLIGSPVPNIPTFFSNLGLTYLLEDVFQKENNLQLNVDARFVDEFSFIQEGGFRNDDNWVATQFAVDAGLTYKIKEYLSFNLQANNLFDAALFDFISVPRPGRNFAMKIRYTIK